MILNLPDLVFVFAGLLYCVFIFILLVGWNKVKSEKQPGVSVPVSIVVCMRNESNTIENLLNCLIEQDYPYEKVEIIISDDFSEDDSVSKVKEFKVSYPERTIKILKAAKEQKPGKKFALAAAVSTTSNELIVMTDADCRMNNQWLKTMVEVHLTAHAKISAGPVSLQGKDLFEQVQQIEFMSLSASSAALIAHQKPILINAANMVFSKSAFIHSGRLEPSEHSPSGDDTFFLLNVAKQNPCAVSFIKMNEAMVFTPASKNLSAFIQQRIRWASKTTEYFSIPVIILALFLFFVNAIMLFGFLLGIFMPALLQAAALMFLLKTTADIIFLVTVNRFYQNITGVLPLIVTVLIYPVYLTTITVFAMRRKYVWKERTHNS